MITQYAENRQQLIEYFSAQVQQRDLIVESCQQTRDLMRQEMMELSNETTRRARSAWANANEFREQRTHLTAVIVQEQRALEANQCEVRHIRSLMSSEQEQWKGHIQEILTESRHNTIKVQEETLTQCEEDRTATARNVESEWRRAELKHQDEMKTVLHESSMMRIRYEFEENAMNSTKRDYHRLRREMATMRDAEHEQMQEMSISINDADNRLQAEISAKDRDIC